MSTRFSPIVTNALGALAVIALVESARGEDLANFGEQSSYFYVNPTKQRFDDLQAQADRFSGALQKIGSKADILIAVEIAKISQKHQWPISGKSRVADMARDIAQRNSKLAKYVADDRMIDPTKLDVWWSSFFATGETRYLAKILKYAEPLQRGKNANDLMVAYAASWSFKSNCGQHKAVTAFAKECLDSNAFPSKKDFLKESIAAPKRTGHYR